MVLRQLREASRDILFSFICLNEPLHWIMGENEMNKKMENRKIHTEGKSCKQIGTDIGSISDVLRRFVNAGMKNLKTVLLLCIVPAIVAMTSCGSTQGGSLPEDSEVEPATVLIYGDSNTFGYMPVAFETHGYRYPYKVRWTTKVAEELGKDYNVVVDGLMGRTIDKEHAFYGDYERGTYALPSAFIGNYPIDIMVIMLGTNDCTVEQDMTAEEIGQEMRNFLDDTIELSASYQDGFVPQIILTAPPLIRQEWRDSISNLEGLFEGWEDWQELNDASVEKSAALSGLYKQIADEYNCIFVDAGSCEVSRDDCIHLTEEGHAQLADLITTAIKGIEPDHEWLEYRADMIGAGRF